MTDAELETIRREELAEEAKKKFLWRAEEASESDVSVIEGVFTELTDYCRREDNKLPFSEVVSVFNKGGGYDSEEDSFDNFSYGVVKGFTDEYTKTILSDERYIKALNYLWKEAEGLTEDNDYEVPLVFLAEAHGLFSWGNPELTQKLLKETGHWDAYEAFTLPVECDPDFYKEEYKDVYDVCEPIPLNLF